MKSFADRLIVGNFDEAVRAHVAYALSFVPETVLATIIRSGVKVRVFAKRDTWATVSPFLRPQADKISKDVAALFCIPERTIYVKRFCAGTLVHELGHACDFALGGGQFLTLSDVVIGAFLRCSLGDGFVTEYASEMPDEWFAESFRFFCGLSLGASDFPEVSKRSLLARAPQMYHFLSDLVTSVGPFTGSLDSYFSLPVAA